MLEPTLGRPRAGENPWASKQRNHGWFVLPPERRKQNYDTNNIHLIITTKARVAVTVWSSASSNPDHKAVHLLVKLKNLPYFAHLLTDNNPHPKPDNKADHLLVKRIKN